MVSEACWCVPDSGQGHAGKSGERHGHAVSCVVAPDFSGAQYKPARQGTRLKMMSPQFQRAAEMTALLESRFPGSDINFRNTLSERFIH